MNKSAKPTSTKKSVASNSEEAAPQGSSNTQSAVIYRYSDINFANAEVSELNRTGSQPLSYVNYNDPIRNAQTKIIVQSGKIKITSHGIPSLDKEDSKNHYYPDDSKREFIKIPLDPEQPACVELREHIEAADEWAGSEEMRKKLFGKKADKYQYQSSIKTPQKSEEEEEDDVPKKSKNVKPAKDVKVYPVIDYVKMKFNVAVEGKGRINKTKLKKIEGKNKTLVRADTITEIANEVRFLSEIKFLFYYNKIWANKTAAQGATKIMYGLGFKIMAVEYTPNVSKGLNSATIEFLSDDEDEDSTPASKPASKASKTAPSKATKLAPKLDDDEEDESNGAEEAEDEDAEEDKSKKNAKGKAKEVEEEVSSKKKGKTTKKVEEEEEKEEDDDDDVPIKKVAAKKTTDKKSSKKPVKDEDDEEAEAEEPEEADEEEEIKPKKKASKGKASSKSR